MKEGAAGQSLPQTDWGLIAVLALGALGSNTAMASLLTCQALYLQHLFGFGSLQFGFVMMGTATFSILVRRLVLQLIRTPFLTPTLTDPIPNPTPYPTQPCTCTCLLGPQQQVQA